MLVLSTDFFVHAAVLILKEKSTTIIGIIRQIEHKIVASASLFEADSIFRQFEHMLKRPLVPLSCRYVHSIGSLEHGIPFHLELVKRLWANYYPLTHGNKPYE